jgi:hypothetical protein
MINARHRTPGRGEGVPRLRVGHDVPHAAIEEDRVRLRAEINYPADAATVFAMLTDVGFQERKLEATGALSYEVEVETDEDGGAVITSTRQMPTDQVPDVVRGLVGQTLTIAQVEEWTAPDGSGDRSGTVRVEVSGAPVKLTATLALRGGAGGSQEIIEGDLKARVPLIGGRIEKAAEPAIMGAIRVEERTGTAWLAKG